MAQERWTYAPPDPDTETRAGLLHRAEVGFDGGDLALVWDPGVADWQLIVTHDGWDPDRSRRLMAIYSDSEIELIAVEATALDRVGDQTALTFVISDGFVDHLMAAARLNISRAAGVLEVPLRGSGDAITALRDVVPDVNADYAETQASATELAGACDVAAAWAGDAARVAAPVAWDEMDADAAIRACFVALQVQPEEPRYAFQLGRATLRAGISGGRAWVQQAAKAGYPAAVAYLDAPEG